MNLLEGSWEAFFEALAQSKHISSLKFIFNAYLYHHNWEDFWPVWPEEELNTLYEDLEIYVIHGGRRPCLAEGAPDDAGCTFLEGLTS